jgi:hypothetical protein
MRTLRRGQALSALVAGCAALAALAAAASGGAPDHGSDRARGHLAAQLAAARLATAGYATDLAAAKADGYQIVTRMIPNMGYHFGNPGITGFDVTKPHNLVYLRRGDDWQLAALEWTFLERPAKRPLKGARYGSFLAACHYRDGTFVEAAAESQCPTTSPESGAPFGFWHPRLVTLHVWLWYPNPSGLYSDTNPLVSPFNEDQPRPHPIAHTPARTAR